MASRFDAKSTTDEVLEGFDLHGKRVFITGVSSGLGVETARALVAKGADVVGAARDIRKAEGATEGVRRAAEQSGGSFRVVELDLASLASVRSAADALLAEGETFDIIIANAGVMAAPLGRTADGHEMQFGTNHLGHFVLVNKLAPLLRSGGRVVMLSSGAHRASDIELNDPNFETTPYDPWKAYGRAKTANALFAVEFDRRWRDRDIRAASVHPGVIDTELSRHMTEAAQQALNQRLTTQTPGGAAQPFTKKTIAQGAATTVWAAVAADASEVGGRYCENCNVAHVEHREGVIGGVRSYATDPDNAKALWAKSEELVGERF